MAAKIKVCGLSRQQDIEAVNAALPDYIGFVFAPSKRQVTPKQAADLKAMLDPRIEAVGVFVDASVGDVVALVASNTIDIVQLHGKEDAAYIAALRAALPNALHNTSRYVPIIKAMPVEQLLKFNQEHNGNTDTNELPDYLLVDNAVPGSGVELADLHDGAQALKTAIANAPLQVFLAGGINLNNIAAALALKPYAIDTSSGAETNNLKDPKKIAALVAACKHHATAKL